MEKTERPNHMQRLSTLLPHTRAASPGIHRNQPQKLANPSACHHLAQVFNSPGVGRGCGSRKIFSFGTSLEYSVHGLDQQKRHLLHPTSIGEVPKELNLMLETLPDGNVKPFC